MTLRLIAVLCFGLLVTACATNRAELDIKVGESKPTAVATAGKPVKIVAVNDKRIFMLNPRTPSIPSLRDGEINNKTITSRAIARKRNTYGMALGDILLPEGRTVAQLARETLTKALTQAGYTVLKPGDPGYEAAPALSADVEEFWSWATPGFTAIAMEFKGTLRLTGDWPVPPDKRRIKSYARETGLLGTEDMWIRTINKGVDALVRATRDVLPPAGPTPPGPPTS